MPGPAPILVGAAYRRDDPVLAGRPVTAEEFQVLDGGLGLGLGVAPRLGEPVPAVIGDAVEDVRLDLEAYMQFLLGALRPTP